MGKGGGSQQTTTVQKADPWGGVQPHLKTLYSKAGSQVNNPSTFYPGQTYADMNSLQTNGLQNQLNYATGDFQNISDNMVGGVNNLLGAADIANNPYVGNMMDQLAARSQANLTQNLLPTIRNNSISAGQMGSSRQGIAEGLALSNQQAGLDQANAQLMMDAYGKGLDAQTKAVGLAPSAAQLGFMPGQMTQAVGDIYQNQAQKGINEAIARHDYTQNEPWQRLGQYSSLLQGGMNFGTTTSNTTGPSTSGSPLAGALGAGMAGYSLAGMAPAGSALAGMAGPIGIGAAVLGGLFS
jgi:hypothetical protein